MSTQEQPKVTGDEPLITDVGTGSSAAPVWNLLQPVTPGRHVATLTDIQLTLGAASGKPMYVWTFRLENDSTVTLYTSKRGKGATKGYECTKALGLARTFTHAEAVGRTCLLDIDVSGTWPDIKRVLPSIP